MVRPAEVAGMADCDTLVIGGGFYGCMIAAHLAAQGDRVLLVEKHAGLLQRASFANQARVHQGYHYPRSLVTGYRSRINYARFLDEFRPAIDAGFAKFYAIGRAFSKVTAAQFHLFCRRIGAPIEQAPEAISRLFDPAHIEAVFRVEEAAFDAVKLRELMERRLANTRVEVALETVAEEVTGQADRSLRITLHSGETSRQVHARRVFNCTYSQLNDLLYRSGLPAVPLKHELAEMALVEVPGPLRRTGVTVMCGPFFSLMPFPSTSWHTLSHVRYTPHASWGELGPDGPSPHEVLEQVAKQTGFERMRRDAARYMPCLDGLSYQRSLWEVKTVLPVNDNDDGRPILFQTHVGVRNLHCVLGAKIDNVYDILEQIDQLLLRNRKVA
jgi:glycine/D-amino acid oxidase-like deaminating enzyme